MATGKVSSKPYLIRALHEWCTDQGFTPYLRVFVDDQVVVPMQYVRDGEIVLNVAWEVTHQLVMGNSEITFQTRFGGIAHDIWVPIRNVTGIFARENGQGMAFEDAYLEPGDAPESQAEQAKSPHRPVVEAAKPAKTHRKIRLQPGSVRYAAALAEAKQQAQTSSASQPPSGAGPAETGAPSAVTEDAASRALTPVPPASDAADKKKSLRAHLTIVRN